MQPYFSALWKAIKAIFSVVADVIGGYFSSAWLAIKIVWDVVSGYFQNLWNTIAGIFAVVEAVLSGDFKGAWEAIKAVFAGWQSYFTGLWNIVKNVFSGAYNTFCSIGKNIVQGIWAGIQSLYSWVTGKVSGFVGGIVNTAKRTLGIHSPSAVMRDQVGKNIGLGVAEGIDSSKKNALASADRMAAEIENSIPSVTMGIQYANAGMMPASASKAISSVESAAVAPSSNSMLAELKAIKEAIAEGKIIMVDKQVLGRVASNAIRNNERALGAI